MDSGERNYRLRSESPTTRRSRWATSCSSRLPKVGSELTAGKTFGTVESVKAVSDLYCPGFRHGHRGRTTTLATSPENVNKDAHGSWMMKITLKNPGELDALLSAADYEKFVAEEGGTLSHCRFSISDCRLNPDWSVHSLSGARFVRQLEIGNRPMTLDVGDPQSN